MKLFELTRLLEDSEFMQETRIPVTITKDGSSNGIDCYLVYEKTEGSNVWYKYYAIGENLRVPSGNITHGGGEHHVINDREGYWCIGSGNATERDVIDNSISMPDSANDWSNYSIDFRFGVELDLYSICNVSDTKELPLIVSHPAKGSFFSYFTKHGNELYMTNTDNMKIHNDIEKHIFWTNSKGYHLIYRDTNQDNTPPFYDLINNQEYMFKIVPEELLGSALFSRKVYCSDKLCEVLDSMDINTCNGIINDVYSVQKFNYIDLSDKSNDRVSYLPNSKLKYFKNVNDAYDSSLRKKYQVHIKIGKFLKKLFNDWTEDDVRKAVSDFVAMTNTEFEVVRSSDIRHAYLEDNYVKIKGTLGESCMRHSYCQGYIDFYEDLGLEVLILRNTVNKNLVYGRALLWKNVNIRQNPSFDPKIGRILMDRVYTINDGHVAHFIKYAKEHGYLYKKHQNYSTPKDIMIDSVSYEEMEITMSCDVFERVQGDSGQVSYYNGDVKYPYLDTFSNVRWMSKGEFILSNESYDGNECTGALLLKLRTTEGECDYEGLITEDGNYEAI